MIFERAREAGAREKLLRVAIIFRRVSRDDLFQSDGEFVRIERAAFSNFLSRRCNFVPGIHVFSLSDFDPF